MLDLLNEESVSGVHSSRASREVLLRISEKVSRSLKYNSTIFFIHKHVIGSAKRCMFQKIHF